MKKTDVQTYLFFGGRCAEALEFYQKAVGAEVTAVLRYRESPVPVPADLVPANFEDKVMHASFTVGAATLFASDGQGGDCNFSGFRLSLACATEADAGRAFAALAEEGRIDMPLGKTFWSPCFGMLTDKFGLGWMVTLAA